jgi:hypothetical protein
MKPIFFRIFCVLESHAISSTQQPVLMLHLPRWNKARVGRAYAGQAPEAQAAEVGRVPQSLGECSRPAIAEPVEPARAPRRRGEQAGRSDAVIHAHAQDEAGPLDPPACAKARREAKRADEEGARRQGV